ncbi:MAG TPA: hypothetical protein VJ602_05195 [Paludibacter sp.]|nr:hypothetical protein [Paludibacter sp.]
MALGAFMWFAKIYGILSACFLFGFGLSRFEFVIRKSGYELKAENNSVYSENQPNNPKFTTTILSFIKMRGFFLPEAQKKGLIL